MSLAHSAKHPYWQYLNGKVYNDEAQNAHQLRPYSLTFLIIVDILVSPPWMLTLDSVSEAQSDAVPLQGNP
jgi:hypothetical protein